MPAKEIPYDEKKFPQAAEVVLVEEAQLRIPRTYGDQKLRDAVVLDMRGKVLQNGEVSEAKKIVSVAFSPTGAGDLNAALERTLDNFYGDFGGLLAALGAALREAKNAAAGDKPAEAAPADKVEAKADE